MRKMITFVLSACLIASSLQVARAEPAPPSPIDIVNGLPYQFQDIDTALGAWQQVTAYRGWSLADIAAWQPFVRIVIGSESGGCPNLLRGGIPTGNGCELRRQGRHTDAGFGQVVLATSPWLCAQEGLCSKWDIIATPWNSMTALVAMIERHGRQPWCYTAKLRRSYKCRIAP